MRFAEDGDLTPLHTCDLTVRNHAVYQRGVFGQPVVAAFRQETVVMLGSHFDQYLHDGTNSPKRTKISSGNLTIQSIFSAFSEARRATA
jgi:hypothetical protein